MSIVLTLPLAAALAQVAAAAPTPPSAPAPASTAHPTVALGDDLALAVDAQLRPRLTAHTGRDFVDAERARQLYVTQRARLGFALQAASGLELALRVQDVRAFGEEAHPLNDAAANGLDVHEAYARLPLATGLSLKLGRQEIALDNQRLVGAVNWRQTGQAFDAGRLTWTGAGFDADVFYAVVGESSQRDVVDAKFDTRLTDDVHFGGLHGHFKVAEGAELSAAYYLRKNDAIDELRHTAGVYSTLNLGGFKGALDGYYQAGDLGKQSISAYLAGLRAGYDFGGALAPFVQLFGDVVSGKAGKPEKAFDTLYATNHPYYGELDYFLALPKHTGGLGLMDVGARTSLKPMPRLTCGLDVHLFQSMDKGPGDEKAFGQEVDVKAEWKAMDRVGVSLLYGVMLPGKLTQGLRGIAQDGDLKPEQAAYLTTDVAF